MPRPTYTPLPPSPSIGDPNFATDADAFLGSLPGHANYLETLADWLQQEFYSELDPADAAAAPAVRWTGDSNTGLYHPAADQIGFSTGGTMRALLSSTGYQINVPITGTAITQSATDGAAGRVLKVGDYGLGGQTPQLIGNSIDDTGRTGFYYGYGGAHASATSGNNPFPALNGAFAVNVTQAGVGASGEYMTQVATALGKLGAPEILVRNRSTVASGWSPWRPLTPERGSNANGEYVRFADGTQMCISPALSTGAVTTANGEIFQSSGGIGWPLPATFVNADYSVSVNIEGTRWATVSVQSSSSVSLRPQSPTSSGTSTNMRAVAIGRWY
jgi:hypothetical protein